MVFVALTMDILGLVDVSANWVLVAGLLVLMYIYGKKRNRIFKECGIPGPEPLIYIGNLHQYIRTGVTWEPNEYGDVYGMFLGGMPFLNIENIDMIREILIKQFPKFSDRLVLDLDDYPLTEGMFFKKGDVWRRIRRISSATFSGSKLRMMTDRMISCCEKLTDNFLKAASDKSEVEVKNIFGAFTLDVIARTAFGIDTYSQNETNSRLLTEAKRVFGEAGVVTNPTTVIPLLFPELMPLLKKLGFSIFPKKSIGYMAQVVSQMIKKRREESNKVRRVDFLQLLIDAEDDGGVDVTDKTNQETIGNKHMTTDEVLGQALLFFVAGYETTASTLHYSAYLLATNPEVQERAFQEIQTVLGDNPATYDNVKELVYLDHVISETQRMFPTALLIGRRASENVTLGKFIIPKGMGIIIPTYRIQRDQKNFPDPHTFLPERWERKSDFNQMSYLPFGHGPRQCIAMRLALMEMKFALATVLKKVKFLPGSNTPKTLEAKDLLMQASLLTKKPIKLRVEAR